MFETTEIYSHGVLFVIFALAVSIFVKFGLLKTGIKPTQSASPTEVAKNSEIPQRWWSDPTLFQAEQRAIFSQTWICASHRSRFVSPGDYVAVDAVGFRILFILGKDHVVRAFHNICRHRAFPVARKASGSATILGCRYHGWSYDTKGQLTKAPHFENVAGFSKSQNGLFQVHTKMDGHGFLYVNMCGDNDVAEFEALSLGKIGRNIDKEARFLHSWESKGAFNWKVSGNGLLDASSESQNLEKRPLNTTPNVAATEIRLGPLTTVFIDSGNAFWYQITLSPNSFNQTTVRCDVYSSKSEKVAAFDATAKTNLERDVQSMVEAHETLYTKITNSGCQLGGTKYFQAEVVDKVDAHLRKEELEGRELKPATIQQCRSAALTKAEECAATVLLSLLHDYKWPPWKAASACTVMLLLIAGLQVTLVVTIRGPYNRGVSWAANLVTAIGIIACIVLLAGYIPIPFELVKRRGRVIGISLTFLAIDWSGAFFSLMSLVAQHTFDVTFGTLYALVAIIELSMFLSHGVWYLRTRDLRSRAKAAGQDYDDFPEAIEYQSKGVNMSLRRARRAISDLFPWTGSPQSSVSEVDP
ncbi:hypothetical protein NM208_g2688 [Fusarium decemcellulare]|uniref:Uncharacterized protein n=1 Tax=Fusarium decemcellulare TaxID=57161 RepID=A0ACC1SRW3_9HYPO|nr:hypothetical protein NM208_g2688 [Fusarium decemcellulare]